MEKFVDNNNIAKTEEQIMNDILVEEHIPLVSGIDVFFIFCYGFFKFCFLYFFFFKIELYVTPSPALQTPSVHIPASDVPSLKMEKDNSKGKAFYVK